MIDANRFMRCCHLSCHVTTKCSCVCTLIRSITGSMRYMRSPCCTTQGAHVLQAVRIAGQTNITSNNMGTWPQPYDMFYCILLLLVSVLDLGYERDFSQALQCKQGMRKAAMGYVSMFIGVGNGRRSGPPDSFLPGPAGMSATGRPEPDWPLRRR